LLAGVLVYAEMPADVAFDKVSFAFDEHVVLRDVSFSADSGTEDRAAMSADITLDMGSKDYRQSGKQI
jgi:hypothetical protein